MPVPTLGLSVEQVAEATGLSVPWLNQLRCERRGPSFMRVGRRVIYSPDVVAAWLASHTQQTQAA